jgi:predicted metal-dependent hydrolase
MKIKPKQMKEQTPMTAEELIQQLHDDLYNSGLSQKEYEPLRNKILSIRAKIKHEQNAKVLEALEPIRKEIQEIKNINQSMKIDLKLAKSLLKELKQK